MKKLLIGVDIDDVCAALVPTWVERYNAAYADTQSPSNWNTWDVASVVKPECGVKIYDFLKDSTLYDYTEPIAGSQKGVEHLRAQGHDIVFITSCGYDPATIAASSGAKFGWLQRHGFLPRSGGARDFIVAADKTLVSADVLVDDRADTIMRWLDTGRYGVLFDQPHNRSYKAPQRAIGWAAVTYLLDTYAAS